MKIQLQIIGQGFPCKKYRFFKRSGCANVALDFKPSGQSGHFWSLGEAKIIFKWLLSHWNQEKANQILKFTEFLRKIKHQNFTIWRFVNAFTMSSFNGSNQYFLNTINKKSCELPSNMLRQMFLN